MQDIQNFTCECAHSPHPSSNKWKVFFSYVFFKEKYYNRRDSSATCKKCGVRIHTPNAYRCPSFLFLYGWGVFLLTLLNLAVFEPQKGNLPLVLLQMALPWLIMDRIWVAIIFTFYKWPTDDEICNCSAKNGYWPKRRLDVGLIFVHIALLIAAAYAWEHTGGQGNISGADFFPWG